MAIVYGSPDFEENSLVTALRLTDCYAGETVLVCTDVERTRRYLRLVAATVGGDPEAIRVLLLRKWRVLGLYGRAELVFYTHGWFFNPRSIGRRLHVNLWHGTGPKIARNRNFASEYASDALSSASLPWGEATGRSLGMTDPVRVVPGNARADLLRRQSTTREKLGWRHDEPVVLWVPTYRQSNQVSVGTLTEGALLVEKEATTLLDAAQRHGVRLIVKPHPFDAARLDQFGVECVTTAQLWDSGVPLSQALAASDAVVSDYSSTWVDAMAGGVPVGLYCPDIGVYDQHRGFNFPAMSDVAAELLLSAQDDLEEFFAAAAAHECFRPESQEACADRLQIRRGPRSRAMLEAVRELGLELKGFDFHLRREPS